MAAGKCIPYLPAAAYKTRKNYAAAHNGYHCLQNFLEHFQYASQLGLIERCYNSILSGHFILKANPEY